jgi:hypothetical protein
MDCVSSRADGNHLPQVLAPISGKVQAESDIRNGTREMLPTAARTSGYLSSRDIRTEGLPYRIPLRPTQDHSDRRHPVPGQQ